MARPISSNIERMADNQLVVTDGGKKIFMSYNSIIAVKENGVITLDEKYWNYSGTTSKYRNKFLGENIEATRKKIADGTYKLADLN